MELGRLILREIRHRRLNFALGMLSVAAATGCLVAELTLLRKHDLRTDEIIAAKWNETKAMMAKLEDDYRKITLKLGFNILILPENLSPNDLHDDEKPPVLMPEEYALRLAQSKVATINHVLPTLTQKVKWDERQRKIVLMGVRGEVLIQSARQKPLLEAVPAGHAVVGYELHQSLGLKEGQPIAFKGHQFTISKLMDEKGNADDITLWINLREAQEILGQPGKINAILALECNCAADRLAVIRAEVGAILPNTRVIEFASQAIARAEARNRATEQAQASLQQEIRNRVQLRAQREAFAAVLVPVALGACGLWIALLTWLNVRDRRSEIGILRAIGLKSRQVLGIFIARAALMGLVGAVIGCVGGLAIGILAQEMVTPELAQVLADPVLVLKVFIASPVLALVAAWVPALFAAQQDPAVVLREV